jgi:hypothetical protein
VCYTGTPDFISGARNAHDELDGLVRELEEECRNRAAWAERYMRERDQARKALERIERGGLLKPSPDATFQLPPSDENVERVGVIIEPVQGGREWVARTLAEADGDDCFSEDVELPGYAEQRAISRAHWRKLAAAVVPPDSVVVKREERLALAFLFDWAEGHGYPLSAELRSLARQEDTDG